MEKPSASPASVRRRFLPWDRPLLPQLVELLAADWRQDGPLDLTDTLAIVPTRQSGRRLREALAQHAASSGAAVFPPRVMLPESLLEPASTAPVASRLETLLAWVQVFREAELDGLREVFPIDPPVRNFDWALQLAQEFVRLQRSLAEAGVRLTDVESRAGEDFPERERWRQIGELERRSDRLLESRQRQAAPAARIAQAQHPELPAGIRRILVLATPDPQPIALRALAAVGRQVPIDVVVYAPPTEAGAFDTWGRPDPAAWTTRVLALPEFSHHVHLCADPAAQAERIASLAGRYAEPDRVLAVGVADPEVLTLAQSALERAEVATFNPEGEARRGDRLYQLLQALARLVRDDSFAAVEALSRCPDFLEFLAAEIGPRFSAARFLQALDRMHARHLPATLEVACARADDAAATGREDLGELASALRIIAEVRRGLRAGSFPASAVAALTRIFDRRGFDTNRPDDLRAIESAQAWTEILAEVLAAEIPSGQLTHVDGWDLALQLYAETVTYQEKPAGAIELQGWLELLWEDSPHLLVAGLNDGCVPESVVGDQFLPETLRVRLGLKTNAARFARDAYVLQALAAARAGQDARESARLDLLLGKTSAVGEPLRPSRLLLRCRDEDLPQRIQFLFQAVPAGGAMPAWRRAWRLDPRRAAMRERGRIPVERVAVTGLRTWLACPFRFYLSRVLRMEPVDPAKAELDVFDFGTLCHGALEAMGRDAAIRHETDAKTVRNYLLAQLEEQARRRFGPQLTLPLVVQLESARQRLGRVAEVQAQTRAEGWVIEHVERSFEIPVAGLTVTGKIDRIDRHEITGALRVLDYKTSDRPVSPAQAHLRKLRRNETVPAFACVTIEGRKLVWSDLQLPLYLRALAGDPEFAQRTRPSIVAGYFNLPKAVGETGIWPWEDFNDEVQEAAWHCAEGVAAAIRAEEFWPPNEAIPPEHDDFAALFHHGVAESVQWEAIT